MRRLLLYTLIRLAVFAACFALLAWFFSPDVPLLLVAVLALVVTSVLSLLFLRRQAAAAGEELSHGARSVRARVPRRGPGALIARAQRKYENAQRKEDVD